MGTTFSEFMLCRPASLVLTNWAWRKTSRCFITPNRLRCGNDSTTSVVVRVRSRKKSRIARRVGSDSAFHTGSSWSAIPAGISATPLLAVLLYPVQHVLPPRADALAVRRIDHADSPVPKRDTAASRGGFDLDFDVVVHRVRHEQRATQFQQGGRLDYLHEAPQVPDSVSPVAVPAATNFRFQQ